MSDTTDLRPGASGEPWPRAGAPEAAANDALASAPPAPPAPPADTGFAERSDQSGAPEGAETKAWIARGAGTGDNYSWSRLVLVIAIAAVGVYLLGPYALLIIGALLVSIILHEFGHYWTAKRSGMKVTEFFVGFGPRIWSFRRGETEYGWKLIPAGAYVRIIGMNNLEDVDPADEPRSYRAQSAPKRVATVLAGPFMNLLIAFVLLFTVYAAHGRPGDEWAVGVVQGDSAAAAVGLQPGDRVLSVDGDPVTTWTHFREQLDAKSGQQVSLRVDRGGQEIELTPTLGWRLSSDAAAAIPSEPKLQKADMIVTANGQSLGTYGDLRALLSQPGDPVELTIQRGTFDYLLSVQRPVAGLPETGSSGYLGVQSEPLLVRENPIGAAGETFRKMGEAVVGTGSAFGQLFTPSGLQDYAGQVVDSTKSSTTVPVTAQPGVLRPAAGSPAPGGAAVESARPISIVGIVALGSDAAEADIWMFLGLVAVVNFALALINLLPVLPFDGGHATIGIYEGVRGKIRGAPYRADLTKMLPVVYGVVALLVLLSGTSILLDILQPPSLP